MWTGIEQQACNENPAKVPQLLLCPKSCMSKECLGERSPVVATSQGAVQEGQDAQNTAATLRKMGL